MTKLTGFAAMAPERRIKMARMGGSSQKVKKRALEVIIEQLRKDLENAKARLKQEGVCMSCWNGAPDLYGCSDCLGTGYEGGEKQ